MPVRFAQTREKGRVGLLFRSALLFAVGGELRLFSSFGRKRMDSKEVLYGYRK